MIKRVLFLLVLFSTLKVSGQNKEKVILKSFIPTSNAYEIYYPKSYFLIEDKEGIVSIYDSISNLSITISSHSIGKGMDDKKVIGKLNGFLKSYFNMEIKEEDWKSYKTKFKILVESTFSVEQKKWIWYGIVDKQSLVIISVNKNNAIEQEEINIVRFMIDNLTIK